VDVRAGRGSNWRRARKWGAAPGAAGRRGCQAHPLPPDGDHPRRPPGAAGSRWSTSFPVDSPTVTLGCAGDDGRRRQNPGLGRERRARENAAKKWGLRSGPLGLPPEHFGAGPAGAVSPSSSPTRDLLLQQRLGGAMGSALNCRFQNGIINGPWTYGRDRDPRGAETAVWCRTASRRPGLTLSGQRHGPDHRGSRSPIRDRNNLFPFSFDQQPFPGERDDSRSRSSPASGRQAPAVAGPRAQRG